MAIETKASEFESSMEQLNQIVESLESGHLDLDSALSQYEKAVSLVRGCQSTLNQAEQRIKILNQQHKLDEFNHDTDATD